MLNASDRGVLDTTVSTSLEATVYRKATWRLVPFLAICFICAYLDRVNISFAKLQMQSDLGLSDAAYGLGAGIFFIGYFLFEIPSNVILERVGARKWIARIMISWGIASALMMFVRGETWFYVLRFVIGATEAGFMPGVMLYFTYWFPPKKRAQINALFLASVPLSGVIGGPVAGFVMTYFDGFGKLPGWQWLFLLEGALTAALGVAVLFFLTDRPSDAKWLTADERRLINDNLSLEASASREHHFGKALRQPETLFLASVYLFALIGLWGLTFWLPELIKQTGVVNKMSIGFLTMIPYAAGCVAMILVGRSSDRTGERRKHLGTALVAACIGYALSGWFGHVTSLSLLALTLAAVGTISCLPVFWTLPPKVLAGPAAAGGIALINSVGNLSGAISPYLVGKVKELTGSMETALYMIAGSVLLAALLVLVALPRKLATRDDSTRS
ncbi:putative tartrate transporter [Paraburkholderia piptadeniae]|uniref:MFS transporter n=2 Tax=Paraburkholderia TaxID=1822464 RepID=A0A7X1NKC7_9BURK|nr:MULTISPECIES: MFS transporter [Paraburkholderia]MPW23271.1 MFS transporter [Paraburkholderia franconis]SIT51623.1 putative tartrate transporter [Paraburkholderia piptadeniae]